MFYMLLKNSSIFMSQGASEPENLKLSLEEIYFKKCFRGHC